MSKKTTAATNEASTAYQWATTVTMENGQFTDIWLYHNGVTYKFPPNALGKSFIIGAASGVPDDWSVAISDVNGNLWTTGTHDGSNGPNASIALSIVIVWNGENSEITFTWTNGSNFAMKLYPYPQDII